MIPVHRGVSSIGSMTYIVGVHRDEPTTPVGVRMVKY